jgi:hypothetical protein
MRQVLRWTCLGAALLCCVAFPADDLSTLTDVTDDESSNEQLADLEPAIDRLLPDHLIPAGIHGLPEWQASELHAPAPLLLALAHKFPDPLGQAALRPRLPRPLVFPRCSRRQASQPLAGCEAPMPL